MKERPILFSAPMVRALLAGTKTQTRRIVKPQPPASSNEAVNHGDWSTGKHIDEGVWGFFSGTEMEHELDAQVKCPYGKPGDRLWVREAWTGTWHPTRQSADHMLLQYAADGSERFTDAPEAYSLPKAAEKPSNWVTPLFMPRWTSRITLEITEVRVQRLHEISEADAAAEGIYRECGEIESGWTFDSHKIGYAFAASAYRELWESINGAGSWAANPWVWAVSFKVVQP